jgi:hypothetical protein
MSKTILAAESPVYINKYMKTIYLLVKTHNKTGLKYLCQTTRRDYNKYPGSGIYWKRHLKTHGYDITTKVIKECANREEMIYWGNYYSDLWNVVESSEWANLKPEEGNGNTPAWTLKMWNNPGFKEKMKEARKNTYCSETYRQQQSENSKKLWADSEFRRRRPDQSGINNPNYDPTPYTFVDQNGEMFTGSKLEFSNKYNLRSKAVRHLVKGDVQTHKGWNLVKENINDHGQSS